MKRESTEWKEMAACKGVGHLFFPPHICGAECNDPCDAGRKEKGRFARVAKAKGLCNGTETQPPCPVLGECRDWALTSRFPHGIIGGLSERDRKAIWKKQDRERKND